MKYLVLILLSVVVFSSCVSDQSENSIYALLVSKDGELVQEEYFNEMRQGDHSNVQSITKSPVTILVGIAIDEGHIESEDTPVFNFFNDEPNFADVRKHNITIKHLLNHTSGLQWDGYLEHEGFLQSDDPYNFVMRKPLEAKPGEVYNYNSGGTHILSMVLAKAVGKSTMDYAKEHLFGPLDFDFVQWDTLKDGVNDGAGFGLSVNPRDLVKIGQLILDQGKVGEEQIVSRKWIEKMSTGDLKKKTKWGLPRSTHGYGWYLKADGDQEFLYSMGYGGQFIFILPWRNIVIVATHNADTPDGIDQQVDFLKGTLPAVLEKWSE